MKKRVLINGFGRIGRTIARINLKHDVFELAAINDINPDNKNIAYLLKYDSTFGRLENEITSDDQGIVIDSHPVRVTHEKEFKNIDFSGIDIVIESSGIKTNILQMEELAETSFVERFIVTNVDSKKAQNILFGVNEQLIRDPKKRILSSSICDVVSLGPVYNVLETAFGIESGFLTTLHPWLSYQNLMDGPAKSWSQPGDVYSHYALGRSAVMSLIPKSTSAVRALGNVFPEAVDKIACFSYRTPTNLVSSGVFSAVLKKDTSSEELIRLFQEAEKKQKYHVFRTTDEPLVSVDYIGNDYSAVLDTRWIQVVGGNHIEVVYWYDNECGYSSRIVDIVRVLSEPES
ncbi:MAG: aldehyde dehydrogenase [Solobacterium sp.]|nr:aldehyde dehydrogenase [Solobacterium sp.]